jgi:hypothetical protein
MNLIKFYLQKMIRLLKHLIIIYNVKCTAEKKERR